MFFLSKALRLETGQKNSTHINYSNKFNNCAIDYLKKQLKENKREAVSMFEDQNFLKWLTKAIDYKPYSLKNLFVSKKIKQTKNWKTNLNHQEIYDFSLQNSIISNDSVNSSKRITKINFLNYKSTKVRIQKAERRKNSQEKFQCHNDRSH